MYTLLRAWALGILGAVGLLVVVLALIGIGSPVGLWGAFGALGLFTGTVHIPTDAAAACGEDTSCQNGLLSQYVYPQLNASATISLVYLAGVVVMCLVLLYATPKLQRARINGLVIERLRKADETYIQRILGIESFNMRNIGQTRYGNEYVNDVLALKETGGHGDARNTERDDAGLHQAMRPMDRKVTVFERWQPLYAKYAQPTFGGAVLLAARTAILVFFITSGWLAVKGFHPWFVPLLLLFVAIALTYLPKGQWRETYCQFAGNDAYTALVVFCGFVYCAIGFIVFLVVGFLSGGLASAVRPLGIFGFALLVVVVLLPASNYALYNHRANGEADRTLATFFRDLIDSGIHGTHSFARCPSCTTLNILTLGQAHPCVACHSMVDTTMNVRTFNV